MSAVGTPALGKNHEDTHGSALRSRRENAPECQMAESAQLCRRDADQKYSVCRRNNRRPSKKGNNPEYRGVVAAGEQKLAQQFFFPGGRNNPVSSEGLKGLYKTTR